MRKAIWAAREDHVGRCCTRETDCKRELLPAPPKDSSVPPKTFFLIPTLPSTVKDKD